MAVGLISLRKTSAWRHTSRNSSTDWFLLSWLANNLLKHVILALLITAKYKCFWNKSRPPTNQSPYLPHWGRDKWPTFFRRLFKCIFLNENVWISPKILPKFVSKVPFSNIPALVEMFAWRRRGDKPLSEPMMVSLLTHICVTRPPFSGARVHTT